MDTFYAFVPAIIIALVIVTIWESIWKFIAMWKAARNNHLAWFICIAVINTIGILPIVYILRHRDNKKPEQPENS
jgi:Family of unknown function (DUF5652)